MKCLLLSVIAIFFVCLFSAPCLAQTSDEIDGVKKYKWEVGYDILPFLRNPQIGSFGLLARKHYAPDKALRLSADIGFNSNQTKITNLLTSKGRSQNYSVSIGHEWQKHYDKFVVYYGGGIDASVRFIRGDSPQTTPDSTIATINVVKRTTLLTVGPRGFFGVKYFIIPSLAVSAETSLTYRIQYDYEKEERFYNARLFVYETTNRQIFHTVSFSPLSVIYISYHF